jgi:hypothetical protein
METSDAGGHARVERQCALSAPRDGSPLATTRKHQPVRAQGWAGLVLALGSSESAVDLTPNVPLSPASA